MLNIWSSVNAISLIMYHNSPMFYVFPRPSGWESFFYFIYSLRTRYLHSIAKVLTASIYNMTAKAKKKYKFSYSHFTNASYKRCCFCVQCKCLTWCNIHFVLSCRRLAEIRLPFCLIQKYFTIIFRDSFASFSEIDVPHCKSKHKYREEGERKRNNHCNTAIRFIK